jgi:hypothetical protein
MLLRDHPLMSRYGVRNWPPVWTWVDGSEDKSPKGEVGILIWASLTGVQPPDKCYLLMNHEGSSYMGGFAVRRPCVLSLRSEAVR